MVRCEICNDVFNPHEEQICQECKYESQVFSFEMYKEMKDIISDYQKTVREFIDEEDESGRAFEFQEIWRENFTLLLERTDV